MNDSSSKDVRFFSPDLRGKTSVGQESGRPELSRCLGKSGDGDLDIDVSVVVGEEIGGSWGEFVIDEHEDMEEDVEHVLSLRS